MKTTLLLCDHAQEVAGKLYILGGGWSIYRGAPVTMGLAVKISIPWDAANIPHDFTARLVTEDGQDPGAAERRGRRAPRPASSSRVASRPVVPPGSRPAASSTRPSRSTSPACPLAPGRYEWQVEIDQVAVGQVSVHRDGG